MRDRLFVLLCSAAVLLSSCSVDPSKHENLGPPQVVVMAYKAAIDGKLDETSKYFSPTVQKGLQDGSFTLKDVWKERMLSGNVKALNVSNQKEAGADQVIIEGHVVCNSGALQEIEELVIKSNGLWVIEGRNPKYSPGLPENHTPVGLWATGEGESAPAGESGGNM